MKLTPCASTLTKPLAESSGNSGKMLALAQPGAKVDFCRHREPRAGPGMPLGIDCRVYGQICVCRLAPSLPARSFWDAQMIVSLTCPIVSRFPTSPLKAYWSSLWNPKTLWPQTPTKEQAQTLRTCWRSARAVWCPQPSLVATTSFLTGSWEGEWELGSWHKPVKCDSCTRQHKPMTISIFASTPRFIPGSLRILPGPGPEVQGGSEIGGKKGA